MVFNFWKKLSKCVAEIFVVPLNCSQDMSVCVACAAYNHETITLARHAFAECQSIFGRRKLWNVFIVDVEVVPAGIDLLAPRCLALCCN